MGRSYYQCDQIARLFFNILAIYNNENLPKNKKFYQSWYKLLPNTKLTVKSLTEIIYIWAKWWNFAKSGTCRVFYFTVMSEIPKTTNVLQFRPGMSCTIRGVVTSVTRLGDFWKFFVTNILTKVAQCIITFWGYFKHLMRLLLGNFLKLCATFCFIIWSHCLWRHIIRPPEPQRTWGYEMQLPFKIFLHTAFQFFSQIHDNGRKFGSKK